MAAVNDSKACVSLRNAVVANERVKDATLTLTVNTATSQREGFVFSLICLFTTHSTFRSPYIHHWVNPLLPSNPRPQNLLNVLFPSLFLLVPLLQLQSTLIRNVECSKHLAYWKCDCFQAKRRKEIHSGDSQRSPSMERSAHCRSGNCAYCIHSPKNQCITMNDFEFASSMPLSMS